MYFNYFYIVVWDFTVGKWPPNNIDYYCSISCIFINFWFPHGGQDPIMKKVRQIYGIPFLAGIPEFQRNVIFGPLGWFFIPTKSYHTKILLILPFGSCFIGFLIKSTFYIVITLLAFFSIIFLTLFSLLIFVKIILWFFFTNFINLQNFFFFFFLGIIELFY